MADHLHPVDRKALMSRIKGKNTKPELQVRSSLHRAGYRYRLHTKNIPGRPDIVFTARRKAIFINGCFWHSHAGCPRAFRPKSRPEFWTAKLDRNQVRDLEALKNLELSGWRAFVIWECELKRPIEVLSALLSFLGPTKVRNSA